MAEITSTTIVPIAVYCFILALFFVSLGINTLLNNNGLLSGDNPILWLPVSASAIFSLGIFVYLGMGFLNLKRSCWKLLFFCLAISVSSSTALILAYYVMLGIGIDPIAVFFHLDQITPVLWYSWLAVFLSAIIVLYYLPMRR